MQKLFTKHFGQIEYEEERVITFPAGLPGFPDTRQFLLLMGSTPNDLFYWLQCIDDGDLAFTLIDVYQVLPDYNPLVEQEEIQELGNLDGAPLEIYNITVIPEEIKQMRVNLRAPIVINPITRRGKQVIVSNDEYNVRHYIFEEIEKANAKTDE